jgi:hypothetical protein
MLKPFKLQYTLILQYWQRRFQRSLIDGIVDDLLSTANRSHQKITFAGLEVDRCRACRCAIVFSRRDAAASSSVKCTLLRC